MIKLHINNSICEIKGLNAEQFQQLKSILSYPISNSAAFFGAAARFSNRRYLLGKKGEFPTGLLYLVKKYLKQHKLLPETETIDHRIRPVTQQDAHHLNIKALHVTPYPCQIEAAQGAIKHTRGIIVAPTGLGKSLIITLICNQLQVPTLIVVPSLALKKQTLAGLISAFGAEKCGEYRDRKFIAVENVDALEPKQLVDGYHCVIIDEFHHSGAKTYRNLNKYAWKNIYYKFGLTATPFRSRDEERLLLESVLSQVIYKIPHDYAVKKRFIVPIEAYYVELPKIAVNGYTWAEVYQELVVNREDRNKLVANILDNLIQSGSSALCLVKEIEHGLNIQDNMRESCEFVKGENDNNRQLILEFNLKERLGLIGTEGVLGEGVDTKPAEYVIIAGLGKSRNRFMQGVGRGVRRFEGKESCKIIIFKDPSHKFTLRHFRSQCKILREEYGVEAVKLNV